MLFINSFKNLINDILRYKKVMAICFFAFTVSFFVFAYYTIAIDIDKNESKDWAAFEEAKTVNAVAFGKAASLENIPFEKMNINNAILSNILLYVDASANYRVAEVVLYGFQLDYPLCYGRYPNEQDMSADYPCVVIGREIERLTYKRNGKDFLKINNEEYMVTGITASGKSNVYDYLIILYYKNLGNNVKKDIQYYKTNAGVPISFFLKDNDDLVTSFINTRINENTRDNYWELIDDDFFHFSNAVSDNTKNKVICIYLLSLVLILLAISFWYEQNKKDFIIRRLMGFTLPRIVGLVCGRLTFVIVPAFILAEVVLYFVNLAEGLYRITNGMVLLIHMKIFIVYIIIIMLLVVVTFSVKLYKDQPAKLLKEDS